MFTTILKKIFKFCASLQLALILLMVIIVASAAGTLLETGFNADVARKYIYNASWFNLWLTMLCINLFCVAAIRYPWKPHQTGFVITHAGIITLLIGGMIDRGWGIEGFVQLHRGQPATDIMEIHENTLAVYTPGTAQPGVINFNVNDMLRPSDRMFPAVSPSPDVKVDVVDVQPVEEKTKIVAAPEGKPAISFTLQGSMMGVHDYSLFLNQAENMGPATIRFVRGMPPGVKKKKVVADPDKLVPRLERYFAFSKYSNPMGGPLVGEPTGAVYKLTVDEEGVSPDLELTVFDKTFHVPVKPNIDKDYPLEGLPEWHLKIKQYFSNLRIVDKKPTNINDKPENPAILFELIGPLVRAGDTPEPQDPHSAGETDDDYGPNALAFFLGEDGKLRWFVRSRKMGETTGEVEFKKAVPSFAPGAQFVVKEFMEKARADVTLEPIPESTKAGPEEFHATAVRCRVTVAGKSKELWVPQSVVNTVRDNEGANKPSEVTISRTPVEVGGKKVELAFSNRWVHLPFKVSLLKFSAPKYEGSDTYMEFESTLSFDNQKDTVALKPDSKIDSPFVRPGKNSESVLEGAITAVTDDTITMEFEDKTTLDIPRAQVAGYKQLTHHIHMNVPTTYPVTNLGPWMGTDFKFSQADHRPEDPDFSGVQILRDPGWMPKWIGCMMICFGIFTMFYLKPYFKRGPAAATGTEKTLAAVKATDLKNSVRNKPTHSVK